MLFLFAGAGSEGLRKAGRKREKSSAEEEREESTVKRKAGEKFPTPRASWVAIILRPYRSHQGGSEKCWLASQAGTFEREAVDGAENRGGDLFGAEEFLSQSLDFFTRDRVDGSKNFIERIKLAEVKLLAR